MSTLFAMPGGDVGEAAYNALTLVTGSGQVQAWSNAPSLSGIEGDVIFSCNNTNAVRASAVGLDFTSAPALWVTGQFDASGMTFTANALFGICVVSLPSSGTGDARIGIAYRYTHSGTVHRLFCRSTIDGGGSSTDTEVDITLGPHKFDFRLQKASGVSANDGVADFYLDDVLVAHHTGLDIFTDFAALEWFQFGGTGKISALDAGALGPLHMGKLAINDTGDPIVLAPTVADFGEYHTILDGSTSGWDQYFENIGAVIKFGSTYFMYYVAGDADADEGDDYVHNRQLGVATSPDGVNWTKYAGNPILSFTPEGDQPEEGIGGCVAVVHGGQIHMYYTALRWISGGDVDAEIRYVVSSDGFNFSGDTLILDNLGDEFYSCGVYVDASDVFHVYYVGPLTGGVGDLKRLSGSTPNAVSANGTVSTSDFSSIGGVIDLTASTLLFYNDADPLDGTTTQYLISKSALGTLGPLVQSLDPNPSALLQFSPQFLKDGDQWLYYLTLSASETAPYSNRQIICRAYPARPAFQLSPSSNIAASAATDTTAILTAPAGKTTGDFEAGKISDDTNPLPSINLTDDAYTEVEFCHEPTVYADAGGTYEFRITDNGTPLDTYTEYPEITIAAEALSAEVGQLVETDTVQPVGRTKIKTVGILTESDALQTIIPNKTITLELLSEANGAQSLSRQKLKAVGLLIETETGFAVDRDKVRTPNQVTTAESLHAVGRVKTRTVGLLTETETMLSVSSGGGTPVELLTETNLMQPVTAQKARAVGLTEETGQVFTVTRTKVRTIGIITETNAVLGVQVPTFMQQLIETDTMVPVRAIKTRIVGILADSVSMFAMGRMKTRTLAIIAETDQLFTVDGIGGDSSDVPVPGSRSNTSHGQYSPSRNSAGTYSCTRSSRGSAPRRGRS